MITKKYSIKKFLLILSLVYCTCVISQDKLIGLKPAELSDQSWADLSSAILESEIIASDGIKDDQFSYQLVVDGDRLVVSNFPGDFSEPGDQGSVYVFAFDGVTWNQTAIINSPSLETGTLFGSSLYLDGNRLMVGSTYESQSVANRQGAVYVYDFDGFDWNEIARLTLPNILLPHSFFGQDIDFDGDWLVISDKRSTGSTVYLFENDGNDWDVVQTLNSSEQQSSFNFGGALCINDDYLLVADHSADNYKGAVFYYEFNGSNWIEIQKLVSSSLESTGSFGSSVDCKDDVVIIGSIYARDVFDNPAGAAYVFSYDGSTWLETAKLISNDIAFNDKFGSQVILSDSKAFISAPLDDDGNEDTGSVYVFDFDGSSWFQSEKISNSTGQPSDLFGSSISYTQDRLVVGSLNDDEFGMNSGAAYIYDNDGSHWNLTSKLSPEIPVNDFFGHSVSIFNNLALIGAYGDDEKGKNAGAAYIFSNDGLTWSEDTKLTANDASLTAHFGFAVALNDEYAVISANQDDENGTIAGAVYVFENDGVSWVQKDKITSAGISAGDRFGTSLSIYQTQIAVGAIGVNTTGAAYIFTENGANWDETEFIDVNGNSGDNFGRSINLAKDRLVIGAPKDDVGMDNNGSAFVYEYDGSDWVFDTQLMALDNDLNDSFGFSVSQIDNNDTIFVGAINDNEAGLEAGATYVFINNNTNWIQSDKLMADDAQAGDKFGNALSFNQNKIAIAARNFNLNQGAVYQFEDNNGIFEQFEKITNISGSAGSNFGSSISLGTTSMIIGSSHEDINGVDSGAAYIYDVSNPPTAVDDFYTVLEDSSANRIDTMLDNDIDNDGGIITLESAGFASFGVVGVSAGKNLITYMPDSNYCNDGNNTDDFDYTINGGSTATIAMTVTCVNDAPSISLTESLINASNIINSENTQLIIDDFVTIENFGPSNESEQQLVQFNTELFINNGSVLNSAVINIDGQLTLDFSLNYGFASIIVKMLDDGGTENGGNDTSTQKIFTVRYTDTVFSNGFEGCFGKSIRGKDGCKDG